MNRTIKDVTVKRYLYDTHSQLKAHLTDFLRAYNFARRLKTLNGLTPYEYLCKLWTQTPERFTLNPIHQRPELTVYKRGDVWWYEFVFRGVRIRATKCLQDWRMLFPNAQPAHYVFPSERYGLAGEDGYFTGKVVPYDIKPDTPIGSWKTEWNVARKAAKVSCRWHDMRHTFVSKMAEGQASDATIMSLAGHLSRKIMERYSHTRNEAKRDAISALDREYPQIPPQ